MLITDVAASRRRGRGNRHAVPPDHGDDHPHGPAHRGVRQGATRLRQDLAA
jgi:hypothetical protein